jgi:hypothetical protein
MRRLGQVTVITQPEESHSIRSATPMSVFPAVTVASSVTE